MSSTSQSNVIAFDPRGGGNVPRREPAVASPVLAMLIFVITEMMFFAGLISAHVIAQASATGWPPVGQPRLPVEITGFNSLSLLASGVVLWRAGRVFGTDRTKAARLLLVSIALGGLFVTVQGGEWATLIAEGLTMTRSTHAAFFYLIVGLHALHAVAALIALGWAWRRLRAGHLLPATFTATRVFWYFVVGVWPVLYLRVYL